jgi:putative isomerase
MYLELIALSTLLQKLGDDRYQEYLDLANTLKENIRKECYDPRDGLYYSVFVDLTRDHTSPWKHKGMKFFWKSIPIKVRFSGCFLPAFAGIADSSQYEGILKHYLDEKFLSPNGLRSTAEDERVYFLGGTSNPSNSLGPVWLIHNYFAYGFLMNMGRVDLARDLVLKQVHLYANDIKKNGKTDECYHPLTGEPIMGHSFLSWNCLIIKMLKEVGLKSTK